MTIRKALWIFYASTSNPFFMTLGFWCAYNLSKYQVDTNVYWVDIPLFVSILLLLTYIRFALLKLWMKRKNRVFSSPELWMRFLKNHIWGAPSFALFVAFCFPIEGNIAGFFYLPVAFLLTITLSPIIFYKNFRLVYPK
ncbi:MAG: hypothetical protein PHR87_06910 [Sulfurospirillaceae bacterium]|nr:hypothetical protein [Sulfurospirillaceae bacterium]